MNLEKARSISMLVFISCCGARISSSDMDRFDGGTLCLKYTKSMSFTSEFLWSRRDGQCKIT